MNARTNHKIEAWNTPTLAGRLLAWVVVGVAMATVPAAHTQPCDSCMQLWPSCKLCTAEYQNEDAGGSAPMLGSSITTLVIHANRFSSMPVNRVITHVCVALQSPTGQPNEPGIVNFYTSAGAFPGAPFYSEPFVINPQGAGNTQLIEINGGAGVAMPGAVWIGVEYPTATANIGHQQAATRLGTVPAGDCAVYFDGFGWYTYDGTGDPGYMGRAPRIRGIELTDCGSMVVITPTSGLLTTEAGGTMSFDVQLIGGCAPLNDVEIQLASSDPSEGTVSPTMLVFPYQQWTQVQTVTVTGVDDALLDGDVAYSITTSNTSSFDQCWDNLPVVNVGVTNLDNEAPATITFGSAITYPTGTDPWAVTTADFDADGDEDIAVTVFSAGGVQLFENAGSGASFTPVATVLGVADPTDVAATDMNADGWPDLVVSSSSGGSVSVFANNGGWSFSGATVTSVGHDTRELVVGDFNGDCQRDIAVANTNPPANNVGVALNLGGGSFSLTDYTVGSNPVDLVIADVDSDNDDDLVVSNAISRDIHVLRNDGTGAFTAVGPYATGFGTDQLGAIAAGDWENDGDLDIVVANPNLGQVAVIFNNGTGVFTSPTVHTVGDFPRRLVVGDYDGDNDADIAMTCSNFPYQVQVLTNTGGGSFDPPVSFAVGSNPVGLASADFDRDGGLDLVATINALDDLAVLLNQTFHDCNQNGLDDRSEVTTSETFWVSGSSNGFSWSLSVAGIGLFGEELNVPCVPFAGNADAFALQFVESINRLDCTAIRARRVAGTNRAFQVTVPGTDLTLCVGPATTGTNCCLPPAGYCMFNPDLLALAGEDCNANGEDDALDIYFGTSPDEQGNGVPDECEGDLNQDGNINADDLALFIDCLAGPDNGLSPGCAPADLDAQTDVDLHDFAEFALFGGNG